MSEKKIIPPSKFVSLHNHTGFSPYDGLGYPDEHFEYCMENGLDAHAITEHGQMNSYAHAQLWVEAWNSKNPSNPFKYIPGCEVYFHPSIDDWRRDKELAEAAKTDAKVAKKLQQEEEKLNKKIVAITDKDDEIQELEVIDTHNALTIENEDETKSNKFYNPVNRRHHLVILPKNQKGLLSIFGTVSNGYLKGFYRFPRIDTGMLREACKDGNVIVSSACLGGFPGWSTFQELQQLQWEDLDQKLMDDPVIAKKLLNAMGNCYDLMTQAVRPEDFYLELQFNRLNAQNLLNRVLIEFAKQQGLEKQLIVTCDAHYARPEHWRDRELYKKLGYLNYTEYSADTLPKSKDELKCELYPKNSSQIWNEYLTSKEGTSFYDDSLIKDAIERTHDIAHSIIGEVKPDRTPKFPSAQLVPEDSTSIQYLITLCKEGIIKRGRDKNPIYLERLKEELGVIKQMKNADYFISYHKIMQLAREVATVGVARGSGGGSLVNYVLYITDLDPIKWDLPFSRFLSIYRMGAPDIDCVHEDHLIIMADQSYKQANKIVPGDCVLGGDNNSHEVLATYSRNLRENEPMVWVLVKAEDGTLGHIAVVPGHKFVLQNGDVVYCRDLNVGDKLMSHSCEMTIVKIFDDYQVTNCDIKFIDITVKDDHRFNLVPFNVTETDCGNVVYSTDYD